MLQSKHQKHQGFEAELAANADRLQALLATGQGKLHIIECHLTGYSRVYCGIHQPLYNKTTNSIIML